jgi:hypothetical protein
MPAACLLHHIFRIYATVFHNFPDILRGNPSRANIFFTQSRFCLCLIAFSSVIPPCGGGFEYFHRIPASRWRRRKGNPVPRAITGPPCFWEIQIRGPGPPGWRSLESETVKCGHEPRRTQIWEWLRWWRPAAIVNDRPVLSSGRVLRKDYDCRGSFGEGEKKK